MEIHVNFAAVLVAALANFVFSSIWYMPLFGKAWAAEMKLPMDQKPSSGAMAVSMILMVVGCLLTSNALANNAAAWWNVMPDSAPAKFAFIGAFFTWLGFYLPQSLSRLAWENKSGKLFLINTVYHFLALFLVSLILAYWR
jgi:hypothetical protein